MNLKKSLYPTIICFVTFIILILNASFYHPQNPAFLSKGTVNYSNFIFDDFKTYPINEFFFKDSSFSDYDYNHYKLNLILPDGTDYIALRIPLVYCEITLYANGDCIYHAAGNPTAKLPFPSILIIPCSNNEIKFELDVKKQYHFNSLAFNSPVNTNDMLIGTAKAVYNSQKKGEIVNYLIIIACLFCSMYHIMSALYKRDIYLHIHFSIFCASVAVCLFCNNHAIIHYFIPSISTSIACRLYLSFSFIKLFSLIGYLNYYFKYNHKTIRFRISTIILFILVITSFTLPFNQLSYLYLINIVINSLIIIISIYTLIISRNNYKLYSYTIFLIGLLGILYGLYTEYLFLFGPYSYFSHYSLAQLIFALLHSFESSYNYSNSLSRVRTLTPQLNASLNEMQNNPSTYISTHIKPDFLYETLNSIDNYIDSNPEKVDQLIQALAKYLRQALDFSINPTKYSLKKEIDNCIAYANLVNEQHHEIKFIFNIDNKLKDTLIPQQAILSTIENSVANAFTGVLQPTIIVTASYNINDDLIYISISDNGIGMTEEEIDYALNLSSPNLDISLLYGSKGCGCYSCS